MQDDVIPTPQEVAGGTVLTLKTGFAIYAGIITFGLPIVKKKNHRMCAKSEKRPAIYNRVKRENTKSLPGENRKTLLKRNLPTYAHSRCVWHTLSVVQVHKSITMFACSHELSFVPIE